MLMWPNKAKTTVHGCHCPGDMDVRKVLARPWVGVRVCHLLLLFFRRGQFSNITSVTEKITCAPTLMCTAVEIKINHD